MTSDELKIALFGALIGLLYAAKRYIESRAKRDELNAESAKEEITTESYVTKRITDEFVKRSSENIDLHTHLRDCEVEKEQLKAQVGALQHMVHDLGEKNAIQGDMMRQSAEKMVAQEKLIGKLEADKAALEFELAKHLPKDE